MKYKDIPVFEFRPPTAVFDMHNPDNYCYCPDFETCAVEKDDDTWDFSGCDEVCKDGKDECARDSGRLFLLFVLFMLTIPYRCAWKF